jgi:hypothetical protein
MLRSIARPAALPIGRTLRRRAVTSWPKREQVDPADLIGAGEILKLVGWKTR